MHFEGSFEPTQGARVLVVILHGFAQSSADVDDLKRAARETFSPPPAFYTPTLPYKFAADSTGANQTIVYLANDLDEIWSFGHAYEKVVLVGHSLGGMLIRRLFLAASPRPPDFAGDNEERDDLPLSRLRGGSEHGWAEKVEGLVLVATFDKGWSDSDQLGWIYRILMNLVAAIGHVSFDLRPIAKTVFDLRKGAPFIVQTRLLWMAYRRWHNLSDFRRLDSQMRAAARGANPMVVQLVPTQDQFFSPQDQVDNDVEGAVRANDPNVRYLAYEVRDSDHHSIIRFSGGRVGDNRKGVFVKALRVVDAGRDDLSSPPLPILSTAMFEDDPVTPNHRVRHVAFVIHGIRDDGFWTHRIAKAIKAAAQTQDQETIRTLETRTPTYGYFAMLPFVLPWIRRQKVEGLMDLYVDTRARYPNATFHYVGHSNGTYLAARALIDYPAAHFGKVYFAGSVVRTDYDWRAMTTGNSQRVERFHNARGGTDWVVALAPKSVDYCTDLGGAGFDGFDVFSQHPVPSALTQSEKYAVGGHSGAILEGHWPEIARFIVTGAAPFAGRESAAEFYGKRLFRDDRSWWLATSSSFRFGLPLAVLAAATVLLETLDILFSRHQAWWAPTTFFWHGRGCPLLVAWALFSLSLATTPQSSPTGAKRRIWTFVLSLGAVALIAYVALALVDAWPDGFGSAIAVMALFATVWFFTTKF
jgi:pimeloyl-ACP methyl ester carboxylesterase